MSREFPREWLSSPDCLTTWPKPAFPPLRRNLRVDVAVVGAGIAGLSTAYALAREGKRVAVLDAAGFGAGMTAATTGHLASSIDVRYFEIERLHGRQAARRVAESHQQAIAGARSQVSANLERRALLVRPLFLLLLRASCVVHGRDCARERASRSSAAS